MEARQGVSQLLSQSESQSVSQAFSQSDGVVAVVAVVTDTPLSAKQLSLDGWLALPTSVSQSVSQPGSLAVSQSVSQPVGQSISSTGGGSNTEGPSRIQSVSQSGSLSASESVSKSVDQSSNSPI